MSAVTLEVANPEGLWEVLKNHPRVSAKYVGTVGYGWPTFTFFGDANALAALILDEWQDGGGGEHDLLSEIREVAP